MYYLKIILRLIFLAFFAHVSMINVFACKFPSGLAQVINFNKDSNVAIEKFGIGGADQNVINIFEDNKFKKGFSLTEVCGATLYNIDRGTRNDICGPRFGWFLKSIFKSNENLLSISAGCGSIKIDLNTGTIIQKADSTLNIFQQVLAFFAPIFSKVLWVIFDGISALITIFVYVAIIGFIPFIIFMLIWKRKKIYSFFRR